MGTGRGGEEPRAGLVGGCCWGAGGLRAGDGLVSITRRLFNAPHNLPNDPWAEERPSPS